MLPSFRASLLVLVGLACTVAFAQSDTPPILKVKLDKSTVVAGKNLSGTLLVKIGDGLHCYQNPPSEPSLIPITLKVGDKVFSLVSVKYPKGKPSTVAGESKPVNVYAGTIKIPFTVKAPGQPGTVTLNLEFGYQQCNDRSCFQPKSVNAKAKVVVSKGKPAPAMTKAKVG